MPKSIKRQNFNVDVDQTAVLEAAQSNLQAPSIKEAVLRAARIINTLADELRGGRRLATVGPDGSLVRIAIPELEPTAEWKFLVSRPHPWRNQLYVKGRRLLASTVWLDMLANDQTFKQAAEDRELPVEAVEEIVRYCELNEALIEMEAKEELAQFRAQEVRASA